MAMIRISILRRATLAATIISHGVVSTVTAFPAVASHSKLSLPVASSSCCGCQRHVNSIGELTSSSNLAQRRLRRISYLDTDGRRQQQQQFGAFRPWSRLFASPVKHGNDNGGQSTLESLDEEEMEFFESDVDNMYTSDEDDEDDNEGLADAFDDDEEDEYRDDSDLETQPEKRSHLLFRALLSSIQSSLGNLSKKTASLQRELEKAQSLEETQARANLIVSNLYRLPPGTTSAEVEDWENDGKVVELILNTKDYGSAQEEADALFALARKVKRGSKVVEGLMKENVESEEILKDALIDVVSLAGKALEDLSTIDIDEIISPDMEIDEGSLILIQERLERTSKKTGFKSPNFDELFDQNNQSKQQQNSTKKKSEKSRNNKVGYQPNPRELTSPSGHKVLVGRNRRDNEAICFQLSRPTDIWMHSRGCPGAHVLLCVRRGSPDVTDDDLQFAADLAVFYSDARTERRAPVTTAEPKHICKPRGAPPGAVTLRQEGKTLLGRPEDVADELKDAREKSGGAWDEMGYRKLGTRAKNKKRTAAVDKVSRKKKREEAREKNKRRKRKDGDEGWF